MSIPSFKIVKDVNATKIQDVQVTSARPDFVNETLVFDGTIYVPAPVNPPVILGGDVTGPSGTNVLDKIKGITVNAAVPASGDTLIYDGPVPGEWAPGSGGPVVLGGDVTGPSGANILDKLRGITLSTNVPASGDTLIYDGPVPGEWAPGAGGGGPVVLGGDVTGPSGTNILDKLRGITLSTNVPASGEVLVYDTIVAGEWAPGPASALGIFDPANPVFYGTGTSTNNSGFGSITIGPGAVTTGGGFALAVGTNAYAGGTSGISLGNLALSAGNSCIMVGTNAGTSLMTGAENIGIGNNVMSVLTAGTSNIAIGPSSLVATTLGNSNIGVGKNSLAGNITGSNNIAIGHQALALVTSDENVAIGNVAAGVTTTGFRITAVGHQALASNGSGNSNCAFGWNAHTSNINGSQNVSMGTSALLSNNSGSNNVAIGQQALAACTVSDNVAVGAFALLSSQGGTRLTAVGTSALRSNTSGFSNVAIGFESQRDCLDGIFNTSIGELSLSKNVSGVNNLAIGRESLLNTTGNSNIGVGNSTLLENITGNNNVAMGINSQRFRTSGNDNTSIGLGSLAQNISSNQNTACGGDALSQVQNDNNTACGYKAGQVLTTGTNCSFLGYNAQPSAVGVNNEITLGDNNVTIVRSFGTYTTVSDARDKKNIAPMKAGIEFVNELKPVHFEWNMRDGSRVDIPDSGFVAQDLKEVQNMTGITIPGLVYESNPERLEISTQKLIPILVKAIQDLSKEVQALKAAQNM